MCSAVGSLLVLTSFLNCLSALRPNARNSRCTYVPPLFGQAFAFLELKTMELATAVLELDGIVFKETQLKMRRPSDYNPQLVPAA